MAEAVRVRGLRELDRSFAKANRDLRNGLREELRVVVEPVRVDAERLAVARISHIGPTRARSWANMRTGITRDAAYVAPKQRGRLSRKNPRLHRPKFSGLLLSRAMEPALQQNEARIIKRLGFLLDLIKERNGF